MAENTYDLTSGPVWRGLARVSAPMSLGIFAVISVGLADAYFLARVGQAELAAIGFIYPVIITVTSLSIGLSAGANAALSQSIGGGDETERTNRMAIHALVLGGVLGLAVAILLWLLSAPLFALLGAEGEVAAAIGDYIGWWALSFPFLVVMMISNAAFRAHGDGARAAVIMILAALVNVVLNPLLIFGVGPLPALETEGAGIGTAIARILAAFLAVAVALRRGILRSCASPLTDLADSLRKLVSVGAPASMSNAINPAGMAAVTAAVATLGQDAVAGFGAATRIQQMALVPLLALSAGIGPVVGQNWGAGRVDRARTGLWTCYGLCVGYGLAVALVLTVFAETLAGIVASSEPDAAFAAQYLRWVGWSLFGYGILVTTNAAMNARSRAVWSMGLSLSRILVVYIPFAWLGVTLAGFGGIVAAAVAANLAVVAASLYAGNRTGLICDVPAPIAALRARFGTGTARAS